jgi:hypothetical protein
VQASGGSRSERSAYTARSRRALCSIVALVLFAATAAVAASANAFAATPTIAFLNPSSFSTAGERGIIVSDNTPTSGPQCCEQADDTYRLAAWVADPPPGYSVFFSVTQGALEFEITNTRQVVNNTWQAEWSMPTSLLDAPAVIHAYVVVGEDAVAQVDQPVLIQRVQEGTDLGYPLADGSFGTFAALATELPAKGAASKQKPLGVVDALFTRDPDTSYVRAFYTTSAPGTVPKWNVCGTEVARPNNAAGDGVKCRLKNLSEQGAVTAVAAVTNDSPSSNAYDERFNESGDAVAILDSYAQVPTQLSIENAQQLVGKESSSKIFYCSADTTVTLTDQAGRHIAGANMDVHATGPSDRLKFYSDDLGFFTGYQPPDRGDHSEEPAFDCTGQDPEGGNPPGNANPGVQGEHQRFGQPDRKHIESLEDGTSDTGTFSFSLHSEEPGATTFTVWADERDDGCGANDDLFTEGEVNASGTIGWDTGTAPEPVTEPLEALVPCGSGASPSPDPTETPPPPDGKHRRSVTLFAARGSSSNQLRLYGQVSSGDAQCKSTQRVKIQMRSHKRYRVVGRTTTDARGKYSFEKRSPGVRTYRATLAASATCSRARSKTVRAG